MDQLTHPDRGGSEGDRGSLGVQRVDRSDWRITAAGVEDGEPARLLGYIERLRRDRYEILWMTEPVGWAYVRSLNLAVAAFADRDRFEGAVAQARDVAALTHAVYPRLHRVKRRGEYRPRAWYAVLFDRVARLLRIASPRPPDTAEGHDGTDILA
jgi:hypothetical protein